MPFSRPTLSRLIGRAKADIESALQNGAAYIRRTFESAIATSLGGLAHGLHGHIYWASKQLLPDTAEDEFLVRHASIHGLDRNEDEPAELELTVLGTVANALIAAGTQWTRVDGVLFESSADFNLPATPPYEVVVEVAAVEAGNAGNTIPGTTLTLVNPIVGVSAAATVNGAGTNPIGGGADEESIEVLRTRLLDHLANPPKGGADGDYVAWAKDANSSVTRAWELPYQLGPGTVVVVFVQDQFDADGFYISTTFPSAGDVAEVQAFIDPLKPITDNANIDYVFAPTEQSLDMTIQLQPNTSDVQLQVTRQLQDLLLRRAEPGGTLRISEIDEAISVASGEEYHILVSPAADVTSTALQLLTLGTLTFQAVP